MSDAIRITLNGKHAMTLPQLAAHTGRAADTDLRHALRRAGIAPDGRLDGRTPLYVVASTLKRLKKESTMSDDLAERLASLVSIETRSVVASVVEHEIDREYGQQDVAAAAGARKLAVAGIRMDVHDAFVAQNGSEKGLGMFADMQLRIMLREGLEARRCQCPSAGMTAAESAHKHRGACERHFEADVPLVQGNKLCGQCYVAMPDDVIPEVSPT